VLAIHGVWLAGQHDSFHARDGESKFLLAARLVRQRTSPNSVILCGLHSGTVSYYGGRVSLRADVLDPKWLDRTLDWLSARGVHPYLLAEEEEVKNFRARFGGESWRGRLPMSPTTLLIAPTTKVYFYDLLQTAESLAIETVIERHAPPGYGRPVPPPRLVFREPPR
jgi:hypothetical protein